MPKATIKKATQKGKRLQAVWEDPETGRERKRAFGQPGVRVASSPERKKAFLARHGTAKEAKQKGELGRWLAIKDWQRKFKPGDKINIPKELT